MRSISASASGMAEMALLTVSDITVSIGKLTPLDRIAFTIDTGEIVGVVGESGSGKSLTAMAVMGLLPLIGGRIAGGAVHFADLALTDLPEPQYRALRGKRIALISQNPMTSLDPVRREIGRASCRERVLMPV